MSVPRWAQSLSTTRGSSKLAVSAASLSMKGCVTPIGTSPCSWRESWLTRLRMRAYSARDDAQVEYALVKHSSGRFQALKLRGENGESRSQSPTAGVNADEKKSRP